MKSAAALLLVLSLMTVCSHSQGREFVHDTEVDLAEEMEKGGGGREGGVAEEENDVIPLNSADTGRLGYMKQLSTSQSELQSDVTYVQCGNGRCADGLGQTCCGDERCCESGWSCQNNWLLGYYCWRDWWKGSALQESPVVQASLPQHNYYPSVSQELEPQGALTTCGPGYHSCSVHYCCKNGYECCGDFNCCSGSCWFGTCVPWSRQEIHSVALPKKYPAISRERELQHAVANLFRSEVTTGLSSNGEYRCDGIRDHSCSDSDGGCCKNGYRCCQISGKPRCCSNKRHEVASLQTYRERAKVIKSHSWSDCGSSHDVAKVNYLTLTPDPVQLPGPLGVTFSVSINHTVDAPLKMEVHLERHTDGTWQEVPCIDGLVGTCTYHDVCDLLSRLPTCPAAFVENNIPCACPFKEGTYTLPLTRYTVGESVPSGEYRATVRLTQGGNTPVACVELDVTIA